MARYQEGPQVLDDFEHTLIRQVLDGHVSVDEFWDTMAALARYAIDLDGFRQHAPIDCDVCLARRDREQRVVAFRWRRPGGSRTTPPSRHRRLVEKLRAGRRRSTSLLVLRDVPASLWHPDEDNAEFNAYIMGADKLVDPLNPATFSQRRADGNELEASLVALPKSLP